MNVDALLLTLNAVSRDTDKVNLLQRLAHTMQFAPADVARVVCTISRDSDKVSAVRAIVPHLRCAPRISDVRAVAEHVSRDTDTVQVVRLLLAYVPDSSTSARGIADVLNTISRDSDSLEALRALVPKMVRTNEAAGFVSILGCFCRDTEKVGAVRAVLSRSVHIREGTAWHTTCAAILSHISRDSDKLEALRALVAMAGVGAEPNASFRALASLMECFSRDGDRLQAFEIAASVVPIDRFTEPGTIGDVLARFSRGSEKVSVARLFGQELPDVADSSASSDDSGSDESSASSSSDESSDDSGGASHVSRSTRGLVQSLVRGCGGSTSISMGGLSIETNGTHMSINGHHLRDYNVQTEGYMWDADVRGDRMTAGGHEWVLRRNEWVRKDRIKKKKKRPLLPPVEGAECIVCTEMRAGRVCLTACGHMNVCNVCLHALVANAKRDKKKPKCPSCCQTIKQAVRCYTPNAGAASAANA